jgi:hypothetical protein
MKNKVTFVGYTMLVELHNGEGQLVVTASSGQSGHCFLAITVTAVDGGYTTCRPPVTWWEYGKLNHAAAKAQVAEALERWLPADEAQAALAKWAHLFLCEEPAPAPKKLTKAQHAAFPKGRW